MLKKIQTSSVHLTFFSSFENHFKNGLIIYCSSSVSSPLNLSSYSIVKEAITNWILIKSHLVIKCGIFVDYPAFGQVKFLTSISKFPILPFPLLYKKVQLSTREALFCSIKKVINQKGPRGVHSCVSTETPIKDFIKALAASYGNKYILLLPLPIFITFGFAYLVDFCLKKNKNDREATRVKMEHCSNE